MVTTKSDWEIVASECNPMRVVIRDLNRGRKSVTNDIKNVVKRLIENGHLRPKQRLFYYDSDGNKDEVLWNEEGFVSFKVG